jgi:hypothetical protein
MPRTLNYCTLCCFRLCTFGLQAMASLALPNAGSIAELFGVVELGDLTPMPMDSDGLAPIVDLSIYVRVGAGRGARGRHGLFALFSFF